MTGNTLFQSIMSVNVFKLEIYIIKWVKKIITTFVSIKALTKSNLGLGVHLTPLKYVKPRPTGKTFTFNLDELRNDMPSETRLENF